MPKYYAIDPINEGLGALVIANNAREAKENFISGHVIPYFDGWDNTGFEKDKLTAKRTDKIDKYQPDDNFHILKTMIVDYNWMFYDVEDDYKTLNKTNFSDARLKHYLKGGHVDEDN